ncbi:MAG: ABC transporter ATP-binding protein [bacterium]
MLQISHLSKKYGNKIAVDDVSLTVDAGEIFGYLGPNGAGKSTTIKILTGLLKPDSGTIAINGYDVLTTPAEAKKQYGYVPESGALYEKLTPFEYLQMVARLHKMPEQTISHKIQELLDLFQMTVNADQRMVSFSKGMKQRIVIAASLIHNPNVLFFDEPLNGLDANAVLLVKQLLRNFAEQGKTVFYSSHILDVVEKLCDRVAIIDQGKIVAEGKVSELESMTQQSSLELVFKELTQTQDMQQAAAEYARQLESTSHPKPNQK